MLCIIAFLKDFSVALSIQISDLREFQKISCLGVLSSQYLLLDKIPFQVNCIKNDTIIDIDVPYARA